MAFSLFPAPALPWSLTRLPWCSPWARLEMFLETDLVAGIVVLLGSGAAARNHRNAGHRDLAISERPTTLGGSRIKFLDALNVRSAQGAVIFKKRGHSIY